jgi:mannose-6-phosphate isomerase-like protein (cupin superfamily)
MRKDKMFLKNLKKTNEFNELDFKDDDSSNELIMNKGSKAYVFHKELFGLGKSKIIAMKHPCNISIIPHSHDFIEIQYVASGCITQIINGKRVELKEGSLTLFNKNIVHFLSSFMSPYLIQDFLILSARKVHFLNFCSSLLKEITSSQII